MLFFLMTHKSFLFILGTRPEVIKCAPLIRELKQTGHTVTLCLTGQHDTLIQPLLDYFELEVDFRCTSPETPHNLTQLTAHILGQLDPILRQLNPDICVVQGDTTSAFCGALAASYAEIPIAHIEAGLRSFDRKTPFPEESNRVLIDHLSTYLFAPTEQAKQNLEKEGFSNNLWVVGNTALDALDFAKNHPVLGGPDLINPLKKNILITLHRREHGPEILKAISEAIVILASQFNDLHFIVPLHPNPEKKETLQRCLKHPSITLTEPLFYPHLIHTLSQCFAVMTDSGGIQEEAPAFGVPTLVLREKTERIEGIQAGAALCVGINPENIIAEATRLIQDAAHHGSMSKPCYPYGQPGASQLICMHLGIPCMIKPYFIVQGDQCAC
jgi:UDP-N-acetylglucosamine 2-epimerase (non-hydrolysing)